MMNAVRDGISSILTEIGNESLNILKPEGTKKFSASAALLKELDFEDEDTCKNQLRKSKQKFDRLLGMVEYKTQEKSTRFRETV